MYMYMYGTDMYYCTCICVQWAQFRVLSTCGRFLSTDRTEEPVQETRDAETVTVEIPVTEDKDHPVEGGKER